MVFQFTHLILSIYFLRSLWVEQMKENGKTNYSIASTKIGLGKEKDFKEART